MDWPLSSIQIFVFLCTGWSSSLTAPLPEDESHFNELEEIMKLKSDFETKLKEELDAKQNSDSDPNLTLDPKTIFDSPDIKLESGKSLEPGFKLLLDSALAASNHLQNQNEVEGSEGTGRQLYYGGASYRPQYYRPQYMRPQFYGGGGGYGGYGGYNDNGFSGSVRRFADYCYTLWCQLRRALHL